MTSLRIWHPFTQAALDPSPLPVARGEGAYLILEDGRRIVDAVSSWWVNLHGHGHPRIAAAIAEQAKKLERSEEHTSELQSLAYLVCRLLLEKKKTYHA